MGEHGTEKDMDKWVDTNSVLLDAMPNDWMIELRNEGKQANLQIKDRQIAGPQLRLPSNIENWLSDLDSSLGAQDTLDSLNSAWSEAQAMASALPPEESRRAFKILEKHQDRLSS